MTKDTKQGIRTDLTYLSRRLAEVKALVRDGHPGSDGQITRSLDVVVELAVSAGARADGLSDEKRAAKVRRVRKALGYTYP